MEQDEKTEIMVSMAKMESQINYLVKDSLEAKEERKGITLELQRTQERNDLVYAKKYQFEQLDKMQQNIVKKQKELESCTTTQSIWRSNIEGKLSVVIIIIYVVLHIFGLW